ncbi:MAG: hypothetical protein FJY07_00710 [Bacteroidetes bacterium]|nr:hypothetical protein [Bacteroidota bacterium]
MKFLGIRFLVLIGLLLLVLTGCKTLKFGNPEKKALKQKQKEEKQLQETYRQEVKAHYKLQTNETRKRMKQNYARVRKQAKKQNNSYWRCN